MVTVVYERYSGAKLETQAQRYEDVLVPYLRY